MRVGGQRHAPAALPPGKTRYSLYRRLGGPQGRPGRVRKISPPTGIRSPDRPARSESLYRLSYPGPQPNLATGHIQDIFLHLRILNKNEKNLLARFDEKEERNTGNGR